MSVPDPEAVQPRRDDPAPTWQRPHPLTLVGEIVGAVPAFIALVLVARMGADSASDPSNLFEILFIVGPVVTGAARYYTTRFSVSEQSVQLQRGLLVRRRQVMPRANIQSVSSSAGIIGRILGLSEVKVSDASAGAEIRIRYLDTAGADALVAALRPRTTVAAAAAVTSTPDGVGPTGPPAPVDHRERQLKIADNLQLIRAEAARLVPATVGVLPVVAIGLLAWSARGAGDATMAVGSLGSVIGLAVLLALWQGAASFFALSGFVLSADGDGFRTRQGAFTEVRNNARRDRIQMVRVHDDLLLRLQDLERVSYDTADARSGGQSASYLSPAGSRGEWKALVAAVLEPAAAVEPPLRKVDRLTIRRTWVRWGAASVALLPLAWVHPVAAVVALSAWGTAGYVHGRARWAMLGYDLGDTYLFARTGVLAHRLWIVRADKIQAVTRESSFFQRRLGLASVRVSCAGRAGALTLPDLAAADARDLFERISLRSAATPLGSTI